MKKNYIECQCGTPEHTLRFVWEEGTDWPEMYVEVCLVQYYGFFKRLWYGLKYIFGYKSKYGYGHFDETLLGYHQVKELKDLCDKWLETHTKEPATRDEEIRFAEIQVKMCNRELEKATERLLKLKENSLRG